MCCAEEVLLSPEVADLVGAACTVQPTAEGHALLLGMAGGGEGTPTPPPPAPRPKAGRELLVLPAGLQQLAVQVT